MYFIVVLINNVKSFVSDSQKFRYGFLFTMSFVLIVVQIIYIK